MEQPFSKKILCLGNNDVNTDQWVSKLAAKHKTKNLGIIEDYMYVPTAHGFYHTTVVDIEPGNIVKLAESFDQVIMLDQPFDEWGHWRVLLSTYRLMCHLDELGFNVVYRDNANIEKYRVFETLLRENKSFCIYPWIEKIEHGGKMNPCSRSNYVITTLDKLGDWATDEGYTQLRNKMLAGEKIPESCSVCYKHESLGVESYREFETRDWVSKLNINSIDDLNKIKHPHLYEIRLNNKCNIACRGCRPSYSSRIEKEYKKFNIIYPYHQTWDYSSLDIINMDELGPDVRVYITGGEPTVMREVYDFMQKCIDMKKTDFDFTLGTNAATLSKKFLELIEKFTNMHFSISLDGYGKVNDYWRWGTDWDKVVKNMHTLSDMGHSITIESVPGIYNVTNMHELLEFRDREFPEAGLYLQLNYNSMQSAFNHPNPELVVESMKKCQKTVSYCVDGKSVKSTIDSLLDHYSKNPQCDLDALREFFEYNDQQDRARNVRLADYIPELEDCRKLITVPTSTG